MVKTIKTRPWFVTMDRVLLEAGKSNCQRGHSFAHAFPPVVLTTFYICIFAAASTGSVS